MQTADYLMDVIEWESPIDVGPSPEILRKRLWDRFGLKPDISTDQDTCTFTGLIYSYEVVMFYSTQKGALACRGVVFRQVAFFDALPAIGNNLEYGVFWLITLAGASGLLLLGYRRILAGPSQPGAGVMDERILDHPIGDRSKEQIGGDDHERKNP